MPSKTPTPSTTRARRIHVQRLSGVPVATIAVGEGITPRRIYQILAAETAR